MNTVILKETEGKVIPFNGQVKLPFKKPFVKAEQGIEFEGINSGIRSAVVKINNEFYKLKGIAPDAKKTHCNDGFTPFGCQLKSGAEDELFATRCMIEHYELAPYEPAGYFQYEMKHECSDELLCASVLRFNPKIRWKISSIDTRLRNVKFEKIRRDYDRGTIDAEQVKNEFNKLAQWIGFWYGALEKNNLSWGTTYRNGIMDTSIHNDNVLLYGVKEGAVASPVDFDDVEHEKNSFELKLLEGMLRPYDLKIYVIENFKGRIKVNSAEMHPFDIADDFQKCINNPFLDCAIAGYSPQELLNYPGFEKSEMRCFFQAGRKGEIPGFLEKSLF